jgi:hypothetical protein
MSRIRFYDTPEGASRPEPGSNGGGTGEGPSPAEAFKEAASRFAELKEYAALYVAAKADGIKVTLRNVAIYAALGVVGAIVGIGFLITAVVLLLNGLAGLVGEIFPERFEDWGGPLVVGLLLLGGTAAAIVYGLKSVTNTSRKRLVEKYENRKRDERRVYGHDVQERAAEQERLRQGQQAGA